MGAKGPLFEKEIPSPKSFQKEMNKHLFMFLKNKKRKKRRANARIMK